MKEKQKILTTNNLTTGYTIRNQQKQISKGLNLQMLSGELVALIGVNGAGKSTLLRTLSGLQAPIDGNVFIQNKDISVISRKERAKLLSLVLTNKINIANLKVSDLVAVGRYPYTGALGILSEKDKIAIDNALESCGVQDFSERLFSELSDGEQQRVMLARALAQDTPLMMLDEPTAHLDLPNRVALMKMLLELSKSTHKAILLSTHELDLALQWCDTIWLMSGDGSIKIGTPEDLVLSGAFSSVFENQAFYFDIPTGIFKMHRNTIATIKLTGERNTLEWTKRALERKGYAIADDAAIAVVAESPNSWQIIYEDKNIACGSIAELLKELSQL